MVVGQFKLTHYQKNTHKVGNLYGTTPGGGAYNGGTVFKLRQGGNGKWTHKVLHSFGKGTDGRKPFAGLIFDAEGNLYGTTELGGVYGYGAVIELTQGKSGKWTSKVLHSFNNNGTDGRYPLYGSLIFDKIGNLYGTTAYGGSGSGCTGEFGLCGIVFELTPSAHGKWTEKVLHSFVGNGSDGVGPYAGVILDTAGNLYGTTTAGGANDDGTVFEIIP
jgi:uncharacterized repeat protein (TIGR03803 family)